MHKEETDKGLPRIIWSNLHFAFVRMKDGKHKFSKAEQDYVAASPFMQLMVELSVAAPGTTIVVQFSAGVGMHVDYRHMHGSDADVRAPHPHPVLQEAPPARVACTCRCGHRLDPKRLLVLCNRPRSN